MRLDKHHSKYREQRQRDAPEKLGLARRVLVEQLEVEHGVHILHRAAIMSLTQWIYRILTKRIIDSSAA